MIRTPRNFFCTLEFRKLRGRRAIVIRSLIDDRVSGAGEGRQWKTAFGAPCATSFVAFLNFTALSKANVSQTTMRLARSEQFDGPQKERNRVCLRTEPQL